MKLTMCMTMLAAVLLAAGCEPFSSSSDKEANQSEEETNPAEEETIPAEEETIPADDETNPYGNNDPARVLALGDSVTAGSTLSGPSYPELIAVHSGKQVFNEGVGGALSSDGVNRIGQLLIAIQPGYVMILYGINDITHLGDADWTVSNLRTMIAVARANKTVPIVGTIPPRYRGDGVFDPRHTELNTKIRAMALEEDVRLADIELVFNEDETLLQDDGVHPNAAGNQLIAVTFYMLLLEP